MGSETMETNYIPYYPCVDKAKEDRYSISAISFHRNYSFLKVENVKIFIYRKVASSNMSRLEAHTGFFRLLMKGIFDPYVL